MSEPTNLWNAAYEASPAGTDLISNGDDEIRNFKKDIRERHEREHVRNASDKELDGLHREGSARLYVQSTEPTDRPDGTALDSNDDGRLWYNTDSGLLYYYSGSAWVLVAKEGDARAYVQNAAPTTKPGGTGALDSDDEGRVWYDSNNNILYVWTGSAWEEVVDDAAYVKLTGNQTISGDKTFEEIPVLPGSNPTGPNHATRKAYVDNLDDENVKKSGNQTIAGNKTFEDEVTFDAAFGKGRVPTGKITGNDLTENEVFDAMSPYIPNVGNEMIVSGSVDLGFVYFASYARRKNSGTIDLYVMSESGNQSAYSIDNGSSGTLNASLAW